MFKVVWLLRRKEGTTFEYFRDYYENIHSGIGKKYFGHLFVNYRRNYNISCEIEGLSRFNVSSVDCVAEWDMRDEEAFREYLELVADPEIGRIFNEDSARFLDSNGSQLLICSTCDTGTAPDS